MVTKSEEKVIEEYRKKEYFYVHSGSPDFIFYKVKTGQNKAKQIKTRPTLNDIDIESVEFVEVKFNGDVLNHEQQIWRHILQKLGLKYSLIHIPKDSLGVS